MTGRLIGFGKGRLSGGGVWCCVASELLDGWDLSCVDTKLMRDTYFLASIIASSWLFVWKFMPF